MPFPGRLDENREAGGFGRPIEKGFSKGIVSGKVGGFSGTAGVKADGEGLAVAFLDGFDNFQDREAGAGAEIDGSAFLVFQDPLESGYVCVGEVVDMGIIADRASIARREIGTVDDDFVSHAKSCLDD